MNVSEADEPPRDTTGRRLSMLSRIKVRVLIKKKGLTILIKIG